jgi:murein DD-endopeptidase MepM/ murein hydrolase activator NlpD
MASERARRLFGVQGAILVTLVVACGRAPTPEAPAPSSAASAAAVASGSASLVLTPRAPAQRAQIDGKSVLLYELVLSNTGAEPCTVLSVEQRAGELRTELAGDALKAFLRAPSGVDLAASRDIDADLAGFRRRRGKPGLLAPGQQQVFYGWLEAPAEVSEIAASVRYRGASRTGPEQRASSALAVVASSPLVLAPPLAGPGWITFVAPAPDGGHRNALMRVGDRYYLAQRFAVDFGKVDAAGRLLREGGVAANNADFAAYGASVHAVGDGTIAAVHDGMAENHGLTRNEEVPNTLDTILGNHVILELGPRAFAVYAHLKRGSVRVARGQKVGKGEVIAEVGNSGHAGGPHLHLHVCDAPSHLVCEGLPFVFERYTASSYAPFGQTIESAAFKASAPAQVFERQEPGAERLVEF